MQLIAFYLKRCRIPECDGKENVVVYKPNWLNNAIPFNNNGEPETCSRFASKHLYNESEYFCHANAFDRSEIMGCENGEMVYKTDEISIVNEVN